MTFLLYICVDVVCLLGYNFCVLPLLLITSSLLQFINYYY